VLWEIEQRKEEEETNIGKAYRENLKIHSFLNTAFILIIAISKLILIVTPGFL